MSKDKLEYVQSCFSNEKQGLCRLIFDSIGTKMVKTEECLKEYLKGSLMYQQEKIKSDSVETAWESIQ
jgi:hypothetical protein